MKSDNDLGRLEPISPADVAVEVGAGVDVSAVPLSGPIDLRCGWADRERR